MSTYSCDDFVSLLYRGKRQRFFIFISLHNLVLFGMVFQTIRHVLLTSNLHYIWQFACFMLGFSSIIWMWFCAVTTERLCMSLYGLIDLVVKTFIEYYYREVQKHLTISNRNAYINPEIRSYSRSFEMTASLVDHLRIPTHLP